MRDVTEEWLKNYLDIPFQLVMASVNPRDYFNEKFDNNNIWFDNMARAKAQKINQLQIDVYFEDDRGDLRVKDDVKNLVEFKYVNAASTAETEELGAFDVIVCRNVFSAFSQAQKERLSENIYNILAPGGALLIGARETLYNVTKAFRLQTYEKVVVYRKL
jgi:chemotaxis methyl-accepting protein methylase